MDQKPTEQQETPMTAEEITIARDCIRLTGELMVERLKNATIVMKSGSGPMQILVSEICMLEVKQMALMRMMEASGISMENMNIYVRDAAQECIQAARNVRAEMIAKAQMMEATRRST